MQVNVQPRQGKNDSVGWPWFQKWRNSCEVNQDGKGIDAQDWNESRELVTVFQEAETENEKGVNTVESYALCAALLSRCKQ